MDRRRFLINSTKILAGNLLGFNVLLRPFTADKNPAHAGIRPRIALIIDDIGFSLPRTWDFLRLGVPITFSILPKTPCANELASDIHRDGHEIMLHQPMEPYDRTIDPGPGALYVGDGPAKISRIIQQNLSDVPLATGVNNHMGSRFTSLKNEVNWALRVIRHRDLYFVDSLTSHRSKAYRTAKDLHMTAARRNFFLDIRTGKGDILRQLNRLKSHALKYGHAIGIGHPHPETAQAIQCFLKDHLNPSIEMVYVSNILSK